MWPFPSGPTEADRTLAARLLDQAQRLTDLAAQLLHSRSNGPFNGGSSSPKPPTPPVVKTASDVLAVTRDRRVVLQAEENFQRLPEHVRNPTPPPESPASSPGKAVTGGFAPTTSASGGTAPGSGSAP